MGHGHIVIHLPVPRPGQDKWHLPAIGHKQPLAAVRLFFNRGNLRIGQAQTVAIQLLLIIFQGLQDILGDEGRHFPGTGFGSRAYLGACKA